MTRHKLVQTTDHVPYDDGCEDSDIEILEEIKKEDGREDDREIFEEKMKDEKVNESTLNLGLGTLLSLVREKEGIPTPEVKSTENEIKKYFVGFVDKKNNALDPIDQEETIVCDICNVQCTGEIPYSKHLEGKPHQKKKKTLELKMKHKVKDIKGEIGVELTNKPNAIIIKSAKTKGGNDQVIMECKICNITCTGVQPYEAHVNGKDHKRREELLKKVKERSVDAPAPKKVKCEPVDEYDCDPGY